MPDEQAQTAEDRMNEQAEAMEAGFKERVDGENPAETPAETPAEKPEGAVETPAETPETLTETPVEVETPAKVDEAAALEARVKALEAAEPAGPDDAWFNEVLAAHPDAHTVLASPALEAWVQKQPEAMQRKFMVGATTAETINGIYAFRAAQAAVEPEEQPKRTFIGDRYKGVKVKTPAGEIDIEAMAAHDDTGYGDVADMVDAMIEHRLGQATAQIQQRNAALEAEVTNMRYWEAVRGAHTDIDGLRQTKKLDEWAAKKGPGYVRLLNEGTVRDMIDLVAAYKKEAVAATADKSKDAARVKRDRQRGIMDGNLGTARGSHAGAQTEAEAVDALREGFNEGVKSVQSGR